MGRKSKQETQEIEEIEIGLMPSAVQTALAFYEINRVHRVGEREEWEGKPVETDEEIAVLTVALKTIKKHMTDYMFEKRGSKSSPCES